MAHQSTWSITSGHRRSRRRTRSQSMHRKRCTVPPPLAPFLLQTDALRPSNSSSNTLHIAHRKQGSCSLATDHSDQGIEALATKMSGHSMQCLDLPFQTAQLVSCCLTLVAWNCQTA